MFNRLKEFSELIKSKSGSGSIAELSWIFIGQILNIILSFVILKLLSKMGTSDYGIYALIITISSLLASVLYGPIIQGFIRFYYNYLERGLTGIYVRILFKSLYMSVLLLLGITILIFLLSYYIHLSAAPLFFLLAGVFITSSRVSEFFNSFLNLLRKRKENSLLQGSEKLITAVILLILVFNNNLNLLVILLLLSLTSVFFGLVKIKFFRKNLPRDIHLNDTENLSAGKEIRKQILIYIFPFILWGISGWLQLNGEKWIIAGLLSTSVVGIYAVMMSLVTAFIVVPANILSEFSTPIIFQNYSEPDNPDKTKTGYTFISLNVLLIFIVTIAAALISAFFGEEIIILISSRDYAAYWHLLPLLCLGTGFYYMGQTFTSLGMALNQPKKYLPPKMLTGIVSIVLYYILISRYGISGAAYTILSTGIIYLFYIVVINKKLISAMEVKK